MRGTHADYSRRLGPVFAEYADSVRALPPIPRMEAHKEQYRAEHSPPGRTRQSTPNLKQIPSGSADPPM